MNANILGVVELRVTSVQEIVYLSEATSYTESLIFSYPLQGTQTIMTKAALAQEIMRTAHLTGNFTLRSGAISNEYFDKYLFESKPQLLRAIAEHLAPLVPKEIEVLAGLEMGGIPIVTALSLATGLPATFVRKKAKDYGTRKSAEGAQVYGKTVLVIEDVITSGGQVILSATDLRNTGANIHSVLCVIDREQSGAEKLAAAGLTMNALFTMSELKASVSEGA